MPNSNMSKAGSIAARPRETGDETGADGIDSVREHDRHSAGRLLAMPPLSGLPWPARHLVPARPIRPHILTIAIRSPAAQRMSMRTLRPSIQPSCCKPPKNDAMRACASRSFAAGLISTPMRRIRSACCARATNGQAAAAPPSSVMNSRRLIRSPRRRGRAAWVQLAGPEPGPRSAISRSDRPIGNYQETSFWHCRTMEMHDFPFRAALGDNKCDTSGIAKGLAVQHAC